MYTARNYDALKGISGLSASLLENHFTLYQGYVSNTNKDLDKLTALLKAGQEKENEFMELKRRLGWEFNGMRLHEYYFGNLNQSGAALKGDSSLAQQLVKDFGSIEDWQRDFQAVAAMRGIGWAVLYFDTQAKRLINFWINEHDAGHPAGGEPILVLDVFEHAYLLDYGTKKADYIQAMMKNLDWDVAMKRFDQADNEPVRV